MKYRKFGRLDWQVSALGFGLAHLPLKDEEEPVKMLRYAIDRGVNFLDVGWPFAAKSNERLSRILGEALQNGYREKIKIAATLPPLRKSAASDSFSTTSTSSSGTSWRLTITGLSASSSTATWTSTTTPATADSYTPPITGWGEASPVPA